MKRGYFIYIAVVRNRDNAEVFSQSIHGPFVLPHARRLVESLRRIALELFQ